MIFIYILHTNAFVVGVQQVHECAGGSLVINCNSCIFIQRQLTEHTGSHPFYVIPWGVEQLGRKEVNYQVSE